MAHNILFSIYIPLYALLWAIIVQSQTIFLQEFIIMKMTGTGDNASTTNGPNGGMRNVLSLTERKLLAG